MSNDPFSAAGGEAEQFESAPNVSSYPKVDELRGHLLLVRPTKLEEGILSSFSKPGKPQYQDRITTDVVVLDGPLDNFDETEFTDMYISQSRLVAQLKKAVKTRGMILGRLDTFRPGEKAEQGNPWGLAPYTESDAIQARQYLESEAKREKERSNPFVQ